MDKTFDCILIPGVLHETENPDYFLDRIGKVMNKDINSLCKRSKCDVFIE